jgi:ribosomal protein S18 acetylase RimI-like enzyme
MDMKMRCRVNLIPYQENYGLETVQMWRASMEQALGIKDPHSWDDQLNYLHEIAEKNEIFLAIEAESGQVVGMMATDGSELDQLYIHVDYQGQGIGTMLLNKAKAMSPGTLQLYTFEVNKQAQAFYEKHGFTIIQRGVESNSGMDDIRYEWKKG